MTFIAVDDRPRALSALEDAIKTAEPQARVVACASGEEALRFASECPVDVAFIDIDMPEMDGITLAKRLKLRNPRINIIFATGFREYTGEAIDLQASGYLMKPITLEKVREELENLRHPLPVSSEGKRVRFQCFGIFEVFIDQKAVRFRYDKTREILAFLVDHRALCDNRQIISALWEKDVSGSYFRTLRKDLLDTFRQLGCEDIFIQQWGRLGIVPEKVSCDFYDWMAGRPEALNAYLGKYMSQYEWAELTNAWLEKRESRF